MQRIMCYRPGPEHPANDEGSIGDVDGYLSRWQTMMVSEANVAVIDAYQGIGEHATFEPGIWEVVVFELPE